MTRRKFHGYKEKSSHCQFSDSVITYYRQESLLLTRRKFHGYKYKDENPSKFFFFHDPFVGPEAMPKFLIVVWPICSVTVLWGTHWVPWCILKPDIYEYNISVVLFGCFKKFKCLGDVLASVSLPEFAKLRSQLLDVFIISSDFDLAQHFSCSVKTGMWTITKKGSA